MKKNKKGFTLIELLVTLAILAVIISLGFVFYGNYTKATKEKAVEIEKNQVIDSAKLFYTEFENTSGYLSYVKEENGKKVKRSCVSIKNLIDKGYYNKKNENVMKMANDKQAVLIEEIDGVINYKILDASGYDAITKTYPCSYWDESNSLNDDMEISSVTYGGDKENSVSIETNVKKNSDKTYKLNITLKADMTEKIEEIIVPVYVLIVLDSSGSMEINGRYTPAVSSSINLSNSLVNNVNDNIKKNSYIKLINFDYKAYSMRDFANKVLVTGEKINDKMGDFRVSKSGQLTNILAALDMARNDVKSLPKKSIKYVVFLTDGVPAVPSYSTEYYTSKAQYFEYSKCSGDKISEDCEKSLIYYSCDIINVDNTNLVFVGYDIKNEIYRLLGTESKMGQTCPNSYKGKYSYYESSSSTIGSLFNSISNTVVENVKSQMVAKAKVSAEFSKNLKIMDSNGSDVTDKFNVVFNIEKDGNNNNFEKSYEYSMILDNIVWNITDDDVKNGVVSQNINLFGDFTIELLNDAGSVITSFDVNSPIITVTRTLKSYLN